MTNSIGLREAVFGLGAIAVAATAAGLARAKSQTGQEVRFFARLEEGRWVALIDPATGAGRRVYRSEADALDALSIGPGQERIALLEMSAKDRGGDPAHTSELVVIDPEGRMVVRIDRNIQRYAWCGDSCLAYISGEYYEGGVGFKPTGAFVHNLVTREERFVPDVPLAYDLTWAPFDSSVYFKSLGRPSGENVYRFHLSTGIVSATSYKDFGFSPSGKYYLQMRGENNDTTRLFETRSNRSVPLPDRRTVGDPGGWVFTEGNFMLFARRHAPQTQDRSEQGIKVGRPPTAEYTVWNVESRRVSRRLSGEILPWARPRGVIPVLSGGRIDVLAHP
ncbi:MAG TPA: hypothetical protein VJ755_03130 [Gemmatimonadales bacterium]|nr:hypothetical protein [Gemmatimonadales bacterium]